MRHWIKRISRALLVSLFLGYGALQFLVPAAISSDYVKHRIEAALSANLHRPVSMTPDLALSWGLSPTLRLSEVEIGNPAGFTAPRPLVALKKVTATLDTWALLSGELSLPLLSFETAEVGLIQEADGRNNWSIGSPESSSARSEDDGEGKVWLPRIKAIELNSLELSFDDQLTKQRHTAGIHEFAVLDFGDVGPITIRTRASLNDREFSIQGKFVDLQSFLGGNRIPVALKVEHAGQSVSIDGAIATAPLSIEALVNLAGSNTDAFLRSIGIGSIPPLSRVAISGAVKFTNDDLTVRIQSAEADSVKLQGDANLRIGGPNVTGQIRANATGEGLHGLLQGFGVQKPPAINRFQLQGSAEFDTGSSTFTVERAHFDEAAIDGVVTVANDDTSKKITGSVTLANTDFTKIFPSSPSQPAPIEKQEQRSHRVFSDSHFDLSSLSGLKAEVIVSGKHVTPTHGVSIEALNAKVVIDGPSIAIHELTSRIFGGTIDGEVTLTEKSLHATVDAKNLAYEKIARHEGIRGGQLSLLARLDGKGPSMRAVAESLKGEIDARLTEMELAGGGLFLSTSNLFEVLNPLAGERKTIPFECFVARFSIGDGVAFSEGLAAKIGDVAILGDGSIDLKKEELALGFVPRSSSVGAATLVPPLKVFGPLTKVSVLPNPLRLATAELDNVQRLFTTTLGTAASIVGETGRLAGINSEDTTASSPQPAQRCEEIIKENAGTLTSLVGGLVFGTHQRE